MSKTIKSLFETAKKREGYTPPGPSTGTPRHGTPGSPDQKKQRTPHWMP